MALYAIDVRPLIDILHQNTDNEKSQQVCYADDSTSAGHLIEMKSWWDLLNQAGPKYGYFPKPSKTILLVKDEQSFQLDEELFNKEKDENAKIKITLSGERHLGAVIGSPLFRSEYVDRGQEEDRIVDRGYRTTC